ncbi:unnamed protein product, partial [Prorocentrum cordatum]
MAMRGARRARAMVNGVEPAIAGPTRGDETDACAFVYNSHESTGTLPSHHCDHEGANGQQNGQWNKQRSNWNEQTTNWGQQRPDGNQLSHGNQRNSYDHQQRDEEQAPTAHGPETVGPRWGAPALLPASGATADVTEPPEAGENRQSVCSQTFQGNGPEDQQSNLSQSSPDNLKKERCYPERHLYCDRDQQSSLWRQHGNQENQNSCDLNAQSKTHATSRYPVRAPNWSYDRAVYSQLRATIRTTENNMNELKKRDGIPDQAERGKRFSAGQQARSAVKELLGGGRPELEEPCGRAQMLACLYIQLFYMFRSLRQEEPEVVAVAAAFLACKVEDVHIKMRDLLRTYNLQRTR